MHYYVTQVGYLHFEETNQHVYLVELHACVLKSSVSRISSVDIIPTLLVIVVEN